MGISSIRGACKGGYGNVICLHDQKYKAGLSVFSTISCTVAFVLFLSLVLVVPKLSFLKMKLFAKR